MSLVDPRIEHRHHLVVAGEAKRRRLIGLDQGYALQQRGRNRHILLDAVDLGIIE
jgi:hypothetical protein